MSHDGQDLSVTPLLSNLMALTGPALAEAQAHCACARQALAARVTVAGKVSSAAMDQHQYAAHGLAWLATYVESLTQLRGWAETPIYSSLQRSIRDCSPSSAARRARRIRIYERCNDYGNQRARFFR